MSTISTPADFENEKFHAYSPNTSEEMMVLFRVTGTNSVI
jgi:hypothetical protein